MIIYIASDHRGFVAKEALKKYLIESAYNVRDLGNDHYDENDDYPSFAIDVAKKVSADFDNKGILLCGSGVGMDIVANKFKGIRSSLCFSPDQAYAARQDDDVNILSLPAEYVDEDGLKKIVSTWLQTPFSNIEKHTRRLGEMRNLGAE
ncbi:MAG: hypothetical protein AUJ39_00095 [Parcubacteria group bacterium CG1_02_42_13]|nr:MAG: hypothetical protein AUJ39_00095 [Parcubacteria group bacterium CG1_02_42_13]